ncbi:MAG: DivIVA domain-containing protein [Oscillospiraceae bacterium]|nr:DivIVA domain-containing protein [Oscillospiraceae bacterium]
MLTPQEVTDFVFERAVFGGYDTASVDKLMEQLIQDYSTLYRDNVILKNKMKVLVDKVEEYRSTEDAMRMALLQAERTAKEMITEAEQRRDALDEETERLRTEIVAKAEEEAGERRAQLQADLAAEEAALLNAKKATAEYLDKLGSSMLAYRDALTHIYDFVEPLPKEEKPKEEETPPPAAVTEEPPVSAVSQDTVENIAAMINKSFSSSDAAEESAEESDNVEQTIPKLPRIDYDKLGQEFGPNYDPGKK